MLGPDCGPPGDPAAAEGGSLLPLPRLLPAPAPHTDLSSSRAGEAPSPGAAAVCLCPALPCHSLAVVLSMHMLSDITIAYGGWCQYPWLAKGKISLQDPKDMGLSHSELCVTKFKENDRESRQRKALEAGR